MSRTKRLSADCCPADVLNGFQVEAVVSVDDRGQMVLPKEMREKVGVKAGDKLAVVTLKQKDGVCCMLLIKAEVVAEMVKGIFGPYMNEIIK
jgi:AbrB family looped-hinge helix DNA binding protein